MTATIKTNGNGYITFDSRNFSFAGDKMTWAKVDGDMITVKKAARGTISRAYEEELRAFCEQFGQNYDSIGFGDKICFSAN